MLDFFNFRKKIRQEQELRDKLFIESLSAINQVQTMIFLALQMILKLNLLNKRIQFIAKIIHIILTIIFEEILTN